MVEHHLNFPHCYFYSAAFILIDFITGKMRRINSKTKSKTLKTVKYKPSFMLQNSSHKNRDYNLCTLQNMQKFLTRLLVK